MVSPDWGTKVLEGNENIKDFGLYLGNLRVMARHQNGLKNLEGGYGV